MCVYSHTHILRVFSPAIYCWSYLALPPHPQPPISQLFPPQPSHFKTAVCTHPALSVCDRPYFPKRATAIPLSHKHLSVRHCDNGGSDTAWLVTLDHTRPGSFSLVSWSSYFWSPAPGGGRGNAGRGQLASPVKRLSEAALGGLPSSLRATTSFGAFPADASNIERHRPAARAASFLIPDRQTLRAQHNPQFCSIVMPPGLSHYSFATTVWGGFLPNNRPECLF